jgi:hypothetical protein
MKDHLEKLKERGINSDFLALEQKEKIFIRNTQTFFE